MRYYELLLEVYDRASTVRKFGAEIAQAAKNDDSIDHTAIAQYDDAQLANWILEQIEQKDPTQKNYCEWLARMYRQGQVKVEQINRDNLLYVHARGKQRGIITDPQHININNFKTYAAFEDMIRTYNIEEILGKSTKKLDRGKADKVYEDNQIRIIVPYDETAACYYGRATSWCTAYTEAPNHFDEYNAKDKLYIILIKKPRYKGEKYQLHWEGSNEVLEIKEPDDTGVDVLKIVKQYPGIKTYFLKARPEKALQYLPFYDNHTLSALYNYVSKPAIEYIKKHDKINNEDKKELIQHLLSSNDPDNIRELAYESFDNFGDNTIENLYPIDDVLSYYISEILGYSNSEGFNESQYIHDFIKKYSGM